MSSISKFAPSTTPFLDSNEQGFKHEFEEFLTALQSGNQSAAENAFEVIKHGFQETPQLASRKPKSIGRNLSRRTLPQKD